MKTFTAKTWAAIVVGIAVIFGGATFIYKLVEFASTAKDSEMAGFAMVSVVPYFAATAGFLALAVWAFLKGHFKDIEAPKYSMLEQEEKLDRAEREAQAQYRP